MLFSLHYFFYGPLLQGIHPLNVATASDFVKGKGDQGDQIKTMSTGPKINPRLKDNLLGHFAL